MNNVQNRHEENQPRHSMRSTVQRQEGPVVHYLYEDEDGSDQMGQGPRVAQSSGEEEE
jgi:hypothetical protein